MVIAIRKSAGSPKSVKAFSLFGNFTIWQLSKLNHFAFQTLKKIIGLLLGKLTLAPTLTAYSCR